MFDPENGGGRRRRDKHLPRQKNFTDNNDKIGYDDIRDFKARMNSPKVASPNPFEISKEEEPAFTNFSGEAQFLQWEESCTEYGLQNSISGSILTKLLNLQKKSLNYLIIDCRSAYEFNGGHIKGAINMPSKEYALDFFFGDQERINHLMKT